MTVIAVATASLVFVVALVICLVWIFQEKIAFQPERGPFPDATGVPRVDYAAGDGQPLFAYLIGEPQSSRGLILVFHGNADLAIRQVPWAKEVARRSGFAVMLAEYRGYMGLGGRPGYEASRLDSEAAWKFATGTLHVPAERIALFGHSLGTAIATELATRHTPSALLLQSPFTSAKDMAGLLLGRQGSDAIWGLVSRLHFDTGAEVARLSVPVSVNHGGKDMVIPARMGQAVFESAKVKGQWLLVADASHSDVDLQGGEAYWRWLTEALDHALVTAPGR